VDIWFWFPTNQFLMLFKSGSEGKNALMDREIFQTPGRKSII